MSDELLTVKDLKVHFPVKKGIFSRIKGYVYAVDGFSIALNKGETLGVVGESGCGKTTAGMAILNLIQPTDGVIRFESKDITHLSSMSRAKQLDIRKKMQIIFQDPYSSLNPRMSLNQIIGVPMKIHGICPKNEIKDRIALILEKVGLSPDHGKRYPHEFSGGQRQRIGIARALCLNPRLIIGDEPVSALDVSIQAQIINLLLDLQDEFNLSYIVIAHDLAVVEHIADRIVVMYLGKIIETAPYKDIYTNPQHPYTQALLSSIPIPDPRAKRTHAILQGDVPSPRNPPSGCAFHPRCPDAKDICSQVSPELRQISPHHLAACHLV
ncbi:MAG: ATP-binding cassette domain-containing protein [Desulfobacteraceae bacterium]|nr:ATP-binding cassette domain-containing protein [Desulfobacteraceae bacterium]